MKLKKVLLIGLLVLAAMGFISMISKSNSNSVESQVARDVETERSRFSPHNNLDIQMAMKLVTHDPPHMLNPPTPGPPLLLFPPSAEDLARLSGP